MVVGPAGRAVMIGPDRTAGRCRRARPAAWGRWRCHRAGRRRGGKLPGSALQGKCQHRQGQDAGSHAPAESGGDVAGGESQHRDEVEQRQGRIAGTARGQQCCQPVLESPAGRAEGRQHRHCSWDACGGAGGVAGGERRGHGWLAPVADGAAWPWPRARREEAAKAAAGPGRSRTAVVLRCGGMVRRRPPAAGDQRRRAARREVQSRPSSDAGSGRAGGSSPGLLALPGQGGLGDDELGPQHLDPGSA